MGPNPVSMLFDTQPKCSGFDPPTSVVYRREIAEEDCFFCVPVLPPLVSGGIVPGDQCCSHAHNYFRSSRHGGMTFELKS